jgi:hypothetical protein
MMHTKSILNFTDCLQSFNHKSKYLYKNKKTNTSKLEKFCELLYCFNGIDDISV